MKNVKKIDILFTLFFKADTIRRKMRFLQNLYISTTAYYDIST